MHAGADSFLYADRSAQCYSKQWRTFAAVASIVILVYGLGWPCGLIFLTHHFHRQKHLRLGKHSVYIDRSKIRCVDDMDADRDRVLAEGAMEGALPGKPGASAAALVHCSLQGTKVFKIPHPRTGQMVKVIPAFLPNASASNAVDAIESRLDNQLVLMFLGPYIAPYKPQYFYWTGCEVLFRLLQTSMIIIVRMLDPDYDLVYASLVSVLALSVHSYVQPYQNNNVNFFQALSYACQFLMIQGYMAETYLSQRNDDEFASSVTGICMIAFYSAFMLIVSGYIFGELCIYIKDEHGEGLRRLLKR